VRLSVFVLALAMASNLRAEAIRLWPGMAPGEKGPIGVEHDQQKPDDPLPGGRTVQKIANVSDPTIEVFRPPAGTETGTAVLVCPGGGYYILALDLEGTEICQWFNSVGVTAVLLKYRVPRREGREPYAAAVEDGQRAMGIVRSRAHEWGIDPKRIGILGFSAAGDLAAIIGAQNGTRSYPRVDAADDLSCLPNFQMLIYPAYLVADKSTELRPEVKVDGNTPPSFIVCTEDDHLCIDGVLSYARALAAAKIPAEVHIYPAGGHGYGLRPNHLEVETWPARAADWLRANSLINPKPSAP
jgi:acetyl esterase/lipase